MATESKTEQSTKSTVADLQAQFTEAKATNDSLKQRLDDAEKAATDSVTVVESLETTVDNLLQRIEAIEKAPAAAATSNGGVTIESKPKAKPVRHDTPFTVGGQKYALKFPRFRVKDRVYTAAEVLADKSIQQAIVSELPNIVNEVE